MSLKDNVKNKAKSKAKKLVFKVLKPFLPFIIIILGLFFAICTIIDAVFIHEVQTDSSSLPEADAKLRTICIEKSEYLNTCHNYKNGEHTTYLLDIDSRETDKEVQWSHLYAIMAFHNMTDNAKMNESLLNKVADHFESTFKYETTTIKIETTTTDENGNETTTTTEETAYILVESDTIMGHYKYNYEDSTIQNGNTKTTRKVFTNEELIGEKYERLKKYLKDELNVKEDNIETDVNIVIQAANGYYEGEENTAWLQGNSSSATIITDGKGLIPTRYVYMACTWIYKYNITFWNENTPYYSVLIKYIVVQMLVHLLGANFIAMADGTVIKAAYSNSYGNMVMIDHRKRNCNFICTWF